MKWDCSLSLPLTHTHMHTDIQHTHKLWTHTHTHTTYTSCEHTHTHTHTHTQSCEHTHTSPTRYRPSWCPGTACVHRNEQGQVYLGGLSWILNRKPISHWHSQLELRQFIASACHFHLVSVLLLQLLLNRIKQKNGSITSLRVSSVVIYTKSE